MRATLIYGAGDIRVENVPDPVLREPTDAVVRVVASCTRTRHRGHVRSADVDRDVTFVVDTDPTLGDRIDAAYRAKYHRYGANIVGGVVNPQSRQSTIKLLPR